MTFLDSNGRSSARVLRGYIESALLVAAATLIGLAFAPRWGNSAIDLLYLPPVLAAAALAGRGPSLFAAAASALAYNYYFTAPRHSFRIEDPADLVTVAVLFGVAFVTSQLAASVRRQAQLAQAHATRNATIASVARRLLGCTDEAEISNVAVSELQAIFDCNTVLVAGLPTPAQRAAAPAAVSLAPNDVAAAAMVIDSGQPAGRGLDRSVPTEWQFHPIRSAHGVIAAIGLAREDGVPATTRPQAELLANLLDQLALAFDRSRLEQEAQAFARSREQDQMRAALLATIGDDLRPPLRALHDQIDGLRRAGRGDPAALTNVAGDLTRLERYVDNLLELAPGADQPPVQADGVVIDLFNRRVARDGVPVHLAPKEYGVLAELAKHPGRVLAHAHLLRAVWGPAQEHQIDYLRVAIRALRQKLERDPARPHIIRNEPAVGYRLVADELP